MSLAIALLVALSGAIDFSVDWSAFRAGADSSRVEFFYAIPYDQLLSRRRLLRNGTSSTGSV